MGCSYLSTVVAPLGKMTKHWKELSVLIAGCGSAGRRHARVLAELGVRDIRACDPTAAQRKALQQSAPVSKIYESYAVGLEDQPDCTLICTPPDMHIPMISEAIEADCHVLCEKPLSDSSKRIDEVVQLADRKKRKVMVALCFRFHEGLRKAHQYLREGRIGRLVSVRALMGEHLPEVRPDYREMYMSRYEGAYDLSHDVDLALWYAGQPIRSVRAYAGSYSDIGIEAPDVVEILVDFQDRCLANVHLDFFQQPRRRQMDLIGTEGVISVEFASWDHCTVSCYDPASTNWLVDNLATQRDDMFAAEDREFLIAVAENREVSCTIAEARKSVEVIELAKHDVDSQGSGASSS